MSLSFLFLYLAAFQPNHRDEFELQDRVEWVHRQGQGPGLENCGINSERNLTCRSTAKLARVFCRDVAGVSYPVQFKERQLSCSLKDRPSNRYYEQIQIVLYSNNGSQSEFWLRAADAKQQQNSLEDEIVQQSKARTSIKERELALFGQMNLWSSQSVVGFNALFRPSLANRFLGDLSANLNLSQALTGNTTWMWELSGMAEPLSLGSWKMGVGLGWGSFVRDNSFGYLMAQTSIRKSGDSWIQPQLRLQSRWIEVPDFERAWTADLGIRIGPFFGLFTIRPFTGVVWEKWTGWQNLSGFGGLEIAHWQSSL